MNKVSLKNKWIKKIEEKENYGNFSPRCESIKKDYELVAISWISFIVRFLFHIGTTNGDLSFLPSFFPSPSLSSIPTPSSLAWQGLPV
jgi:hypothetical protein